MSVLLETDIAEPRILKDRLVTSVDGTSWDTRLSSGVWVDPITSTLMLTPLCITPTWATTFSGSYARLAKSDFTMPTPASWIENNRRGVGDIYLESLGVNEVVTTVATWPINKPFLVSFYPPGAQTISRGIAMECGWGVPGAVGTVSVRMFTNGDFEIYKGTSTTPVAVIQPGGAPSFDKRPSKGVAERTFDILLIPSRRRDLIVVTSEGAGFCHSFADLDPASPTNTITPSAHFWFNVPQGKASVQCVPIKFGTSGDGFGQANTFRYAPSNTQVFTATYATDLPGYGTQAFTLNLVEAVNLLTFVPNGVKKDVRINAHLTGDGNSTPFIYAVDFKTPRTAGTTNGDTPFNMTSYVTSMELRVPEYGPTTLDFDTRTPAKMQTAGMPQVLVTGDRPTRLVVDGVDVWRGTLAKPQPTIGQIADLTKVPWRGTDRWLQFILYTFADTFPYDGLTFNSSVLDLATMPGFDPADCDITADTFALPVSTGVSAGEWALLPQRDDSVERWLRKLLMDYAATWIVGWAPSLTGYKFRFRSPASFGVTPVLSIYRTTADALAAGVPANKVARFTVRQLDELPEHAEANQTLVVGYDPRLRTYVQSQYDDAASQDPTTVPASRPTNWRGQTVRYQLIDPAFTTQASADKARDIVTDRYTVGRGVVEWESDLLVKPDGVPAWKGETVRIIQKGSTTTAYGDFRILSFRCNFVKLQKTVDDLAFVRTAHYRGIRVG